MHDLRGLWRLLQVYILAGQADPLREALDDQHGDQYAGKQGPAKITQSLEHERILGVGEGHGGAAGRERARSYTGFPNAGDGP
ncbi:hypothetical protein D3C78_997030 [compost metagenome]